MKKSFYIFITLVLILYLIPFAHSLKIGFIEGGGDDSPFAQTAFENAKIEYKVITKDDYQLARLMEFDVIGVGVIAYDKNEDLKAKFSNVNEYVKKGGYLVTLDYQQDASWKPEYMPVSITITDDDIEEGADLEIIQHPIWNTPNKITKDHFIGWGAADFVADTAREVKAPWKALLVANKYPVVSVANAGSGVVVFSSLQILQALGRTGNKNIAQVLENFLFWRGPMAVEPRGKLSTTWAELKR